jgi:hypothetical protein
LSSEEGLLLPGGNNNTNDEDESSKQSVYVAMATLILSIPALIGM